ncbi:MAG: hypothetical protein MJ171_00775 [Clostridia bacterium]|nr:hypothetical protein [Clostridia bacterium]
MLKVLHKKQRSALYYALFKGKKKGSMSGKGTIITLMLLFLFSFVSLLFAFVGTSFMFSDILFPVEMFWLYFGLMAAISIFVSAFADAFSTATTLYAAKDDEFLRTLPIKESTILMSRIVSVFILGFIFNFSVMAPAYGVYWAFMGFSWKTLVAALIMLPVSTVLITVVTCIIAYVIHEISVKVKSKIVTALITISMLVGIYYFIYFRMNTALEKLMENIFTIGEVMKNRVWFIYLIGQAFSGDFISILLFTAITAALFAVTLSVLSYSMRHEKKKGYTKKETEVKGSDIKVSSVERTLFRKELRHFVNSFPYLLNCGLSAVMFIIAAVALAVKAGDLVPLLSMMGADVILDAMPLAVSAVAVLLSAMGTVTAPALSLEGRSIWILKSLPVDPKAVFRSKSKLFIFADIIPAMVLVTVASISFKMDILTALVMAVLTLSLLTVISEAGMVLGIKHVNLSWDNETVAVKQGVPVLFIMLIGFLLALLTGGIGFLLAGKIDLRIIMGVLTLLSLAAVFLLEKWIMTKGVKIFNEL